MSHGNCSHYVYDFLESNLSNLEILIHTYGSLNFKFYFQYEKFIKIISFYSVGYLTPQSQGWATKWNYLNVKVKATGSMCGCLQNSISQFKVDTDVLLTPHKKQSSYIHTIRQTTTDAANVSKTDVNKLTNLSVKGIIFLSLNTSMPTCSKEDKHKTYLIIIIKKRQKKTSS